MGSDHSAFLNLEYQFEEPLNIHLSNLSFSNITLARLSTFLDLRGANVTITNLQIS